MFVLKNGNQMRRIKKNVVTALVVSGVWLLMQIVVLIVVNAKKSSFFSVGPSARLLLPFTEDTIIDTWGEWAWLVIFSVISTAVMVYNSAMFTPWVESVAMNPEIKLPHDKRETLIMVNVAWFIQMITGAVTVIYTSTQADVAFMAALAGIITYWRCSVIIVYDPARDRLDDNDRDKSIFELNEEPDHRLFQPFEIQDYPDMDLDDLTQATLVTIKTAGMDV